MVLLVYDEQLHALVLPGQHPPTGRARPFFSTSAAVGGAACRSSCAEGSTQAVTVQLLLLLMLAVTAKEVSLTAATWGQPSW
jgi:hypothetical protein